MSDIVKDKTVLPCTVVYEGEVQELMRSCLAMDPEQGYPEARKLLKQRCGQSYKITTA